MIDYSPPARNVCRCEATVDAVEGIRCRCVADRTARATVCRECRKGRHVDQTGTRR